LCQGLENNVRNSYKKKDFFHNAYQKIDKKNARLSTMKRGINGGAIRDGYDYWLS